MVLLALHCTLFDSTPGSGSGQDLASHALDRLHADESLVVAWRMAPWMSGKARRRHHGVIDMYSLYVKFTSRNAITFGRRYCLRKAPNRLHHRSLRP